MTEWTDGADLVPSLTAAGPARRKPWKLEAGERKALLQDHLPRAGVDGEARPRREWPRIEALREKQESASSVAAARGGSSPT
jgi:hypothetical protein